MATTESYINYVCEQLDGIGSIRYKKMFGEYMVYLNDKPVMIVCDDTPFVKKLDIIKEEMKNAETSFPYEGAKEHYILDIDNIEFSKKIISKIETVTKIPKKKTNNKVY